MLSRISSSSRRAGLSLSRWNRIEVCRMRSTRSNTSAPSWSRTVSPRMRPSSLISVRSRASSASSTRLARISVSEGMVWGDMAGYSRGLPGSSGVCKFFAAVQDKDGGCPFRFPAQGRDYKKSDPPPCPLPIGIAQAALEDFSGIFPRQIGLDFDVFRHLVVGELCLEAGAKGGDIERSAGLRLHHRHQRLAEFLIGNAEHRAIMDAGNGVQRRLDLGRIDVDTAGNHHVALAVTDKDIAVLVDIADVAGRNESLAINLGTLVGLVVVGEIRI